MGLAKELVEQQVFFRRELSERVGWFIGLRWVAIFFAVLGTWAGHRLELQLALGPIAVTIGCIAAYNILFSVICRYLRRLSPDHERPFEICAHGQILCDLTALFALVFFTGGFHSPLLLFAVFHIILAGILLEPMYAYVYSGIIVAVMGLLGYLQHVGVLHPPIEVFNRPMFIPGREAGELLLIFAVLTTAMLVTAFLVTSIKRSLRVKGRTLLVFCKELDAANAKLNALYTMVKQMAVCAGFQELMDAATSGTARIMGVKACSIKLLDEQHRVLRFASTYGLSQDYLARGDIDLDKSPINQKIIDGAFYTIGKIEEKDYFQYPENIRKEGIASMICLPLKVEKRVLGVFCVYSQATFSFSDQEVDFFSLVTELTALAMQNLKSELNKAWFLQKAAHQLRSPLAAMDTTLKVLRKAYVGPLNDRQSEMLLQCERRIESLSDLMQDLLKLGIKRTDSGPVAMRPLALEPIVRQLAAVFQTEARERKVDLTLSIDPGVPPILGDEKLVDDLFTNLLSNAIKYSPPGKKVTVSLEKEDDGRICLQVADSGIGIPEEQIPRLFTEFFRAENAKAFTGQGTGLGLVIVKEAVDRLRGIIQIESREGRGTRVICRFPPWQPALCQG
jgi:two-component sensor histidine kinase